MNFSRSGDLRGWLKVTWTKRSHHSQTAHRPLPFLPSSTHHVSHCLSNVAQAKCGQLRNLFVLLQQISTIVTASCKTTVVRAIHREEVSSHEVRLSELHGTPQRHKSTSLLRNNGRTVLRMPVTHWTNCEFPTRFYLWIMFALRLQMAVR